MWADAFSLGQHFRYRCRSDMSYKIAHSWSYVFVHISSQTMLNIGRHSFMKADVKRGCSLSHDWVCYSCVLFSFFLNFNLKMYESQGRWLQDCIEHLEYSHPSFVSSWLGNMNFNDLFLKHKLPLQSLPQSPEVFNAEEHLVLYYWRGRGL